MHIKNVPVSFFVGLAAVIVSTCVVANGQTLTVQLLRTFSYPTPPYMLTGAGGINDRGDNVSPLVTTNPTSVSGTIYHGFGNDSHTFAPPFNDPDQTGFFTEPSDINNNFVICGTYGTSDEAQHGFLESGGVFTTFDAPVDNILYTDIFGENDLGDFVGSFLTTDGQTTGFIVLGGQFFAIQVEGASYTALRGINNLGQAVGAYEVAGSFDLHGFMRNPDGTLIYPIDYPGAENTGPSGINDAGLIVGFWAAPPGAHAFVLQLPDTFASYDVPRRKGKDTEFMDINNLGVISGCYIGRGRREYGLIAQVLSQ